MVRGFKLEMSDAQHITDVYSKVASISASNTQELATAMSKTALVSPLPILVAR